MARGDASGVAAALANTLLVGRLLDRSPCRRLRPFAACRSVPRWPCGAACHGGLVEIIEAYVDAGAPYGTDRKVKETSIKSALLRLSAERVIPPRCTTGKARCLTLAKRSDRRRAEFAIE